MAISVVFWQISYVLSVVIKLFYVLDPRLLHGQMLTKMAIKISSLVPWQTNDSSCTSIME